MSPDSKPSQPTDDPIEPVDQDALDGLISKSAFSRRQVEALLDHTLFPSAPRSKKRLAADLLLKVPKAEQELIKLLKQAFPDAVVTRVGPIASQ